MHTTKADEVMKYAVSDRSVFQTLTTPPYSPTTLVPCDWWARTTRTTRTVESLATIQVMLSLRSFLFLLAVLAACMTPAMATSLRGDEVVDDTVEVCMFVCVVRVVHVAASIVVVAAAALSLLVSFSRDRSAFSGCRSDR